MLFLILLVQQRTILILQPIFKFSFHAGIINDHREAYFQLKNQKEKRTFTAGIVESIQEVGRFLVRDKHTWKEASFETARQKVAHAMQYRQRCIVNASNCFSSEMYDSSSSFHGGVKTLDDELYDIYSTSDNEQKWQRSERIADSSTQGNSLLQETVTGSTTTATEIHPTNVQVVSDEMGDHLSNHFSTGSRRYESAFDFTSSKDYYTLRDDNVPLNSIVMMASQVSQSFNVPVGYDEAVLSKTPDEQQSACDVPLPSQSMQRGTSDFSFGDFLLTGEFMSSTEY